MLVSLAMLPLAQVMILGTYHFGNPGLDAVKSQIRDTMSAERQTEIEDLVKRLAKFKPTKIAIEATPERADEINKRFASYLGGTYQLTANEVDQVGFRLAKQCGITSLTPIDNQLDLDFGSIFKFVGEHDQDRAHRLDELIQVLGRKFEEWDQRYSVGQILAIHNSPAFVAKSHQFYVSLSDLTDGKVFPGADMLGDWYKRNARIYGNLRRSINPGDRVLVIYGSGHAKILREYVQDSGELELVSASKYLPTCPLQASELGFMNGAENRERL